ncbi:hypothetical protein MBRA_06341 [Methylobacterium brachiatum]|nr:hypothetical protein MBRA_06341 [Methylobacterium brachiatum]
MAHGNRTFRTTLALSIGHGREHELDMVLTYRFMPGYPGSHDEPGQPDSAEILAARIVPPGGVEVEVPAWLPPLIEADEELLAALVEDARAYDAGERDAAAEQRWDKDRRSAA